MRLFDPKEQSGWVVVVDWERFQHYGDRTPIWIKTYLDLLDKDEYVDLPGGARAVLHGLWLLTARSRGTVRADTRKISRALSLKVTTQQLESLVDAGFIRIAATKPDSKSGADPDHALRARARAEGEGDKEKEKTLGVDVGTNGAGADEVEGLPVHQELLVGKLLTAIGDHGDVGTPWVIRTYAERLPEGALTKVLESLTTAEPKNRAAYVVKALKSELEQVSPA